MTASDSNDRRDATRELATALEAARVAAAESRSEYVRRVHLLLGLLAARANGARRVLDVMQVDAAALLGRAQAAAGVGRHDQPDPARIPYDMAGVQALKAALTEALAVRSAAVGTEHLLLALTQPPERRWIAFLTSRSWRPVRVVLHEFGLTHEAVRERVVAGSLGAA